MSLQTSHLKIDIGGMSLAVQWLGCCASIGLPLQGAGWGTKNPHVVWYGPKIKKDTLPKCIFLHNLNKARCSLC